MYPFDPNVELLKRYKEWEPCHRCGKQEYTARCCGKYWCAGCIDSHFDQDDPEFCEVLRMDPDRPDLLVKGEKRAEVFTMPDLTEPEGSTAEEIIEMRTDPSLSVTTQAARQVWEYLYQMPWPEEWRVGWMNDAQFGVCSFGQKLILLSWNRHQDCADRNQVLDTLCHELVHLRHPRLHHGKKFSRLVLSACGQLAGDPPQLALLDEPRQALTQQLRALRRSAQQGDSAARGLLAKQRSLHARRLALEARAFGFAAREEHHKLSADEGQGDK